MHVPWCMSGSRSGKCDILHIIAHHVYCQLLTMCHYALLAKNVHVPILAADRESIKQNIEVWMFKLNEIIILYKHRKVLHSPQDMQKFISLTIIPIFARKAKHSSPTESSRCILQILCMLQLRLNQWENIADVNEKAVYICNVFRHWISSCSPSS